MFCPNCGKDCGEARFCIFCGTQLQTETRQEAAKAVWRVGMPCPYCGGTKLEGNRCAFCGTELFEKNKPSTKKLILREQHRVYMQKVMEGNHARRYAGSGESSIQYESTVMRFYQGTKCLCTVPYEDLLIVDLHRSWGPFDGWMTVRYEKNRDQPLPRTLAAAKEDLTTIIFPASEADGYQYLYDITAVIAENNRIVAHL